MAGISSIMADVQAVIRLHSKRTPSSFYCEECNKPFPCITIQTLGNSYVLLSNLKPISEYLEERQ